MFKQDTVFILGAGASAEFGLPVGLGLAQRIREKMDVRFDRGYIPVGAGDHTLYEFVKNTIGQDQSSQLCSAFWRIRDGITFSNSIDDFLDSHQDDQLMRIAGKAAIVASIIEAEQNSALMPKEKEKRFDVSKVEKTWLMKLIRMMGTGVSADHIFDRVSFISFNYDRTLEFFLWQAIRDLYALTEQQSRDIMAKAKIYHLYGSIGSLFDLQETIAFGGFRGYTIGYAGLADKIYTYTEQVRDKKDVVAIHEILRNAYQVVFLGFGFHLQNMQLLEAKFDSKHVYATVYQTSSPNQLEIKNRVRNMFADDVQSFSSDFIHLLDSTAAGLLDEYRLRLMA